MTDSWRGFPQRGKETAHAVVVAPFLGRQNVATTTRLIGRELIVLVKIFLDVVINCSRTVARGLGGPSLDRGLRSRRGGEFRTEEADAAGWTPFPSTGGRLLQVEGLLGGPEVIDPDLAPGVPQGQGGTVPVKVNGGQRLGHAD